MVGIYLIINSINGKVYIGSSIDIECRWYEHKYFLNNNSHKNNHLQSAWNKYGEDAFHFCIVEECSIDELIAIEQIWINGSFGKNCYNKSPSAGSTLGKYHSEETKLKISIANKGNKWSEESKAKIIGRKFSREVIDRRTASRMKTYNKEVYSKARIGNQHRRDNDKWPHELGVKCKCEECTQRKRNYHKLRNAKRASGKWNYRNGKQIKNELDY